MPAWGNLGLSNSHVDQASHNNIAHNSANTLASAPFKLVIQGEELDGRSRIPWPRRLNKKVEEKKRQSWSTRELSNSAAE